MTTPLQADPITLVVGSRTDQVCPRLGSGVPVLIFNADTVNTAYVGYSKGIGITNATPISPLTFTVMDGSRSLYGFCPTANVMLNITPGGSVQSPSPAQIAAQIALAGVPSIDVPALIAIVVQHTVAAGASFTYTPAHIAVNKYQSWTCKMFCTATSSGLGTNPSVLFEMAWSVAADNFDPLVTHDWTVASTPFNFLYNYINEGEGPMFGDTLDVTWTNNDTQPVNVTFAFFGSYRTRIRPKLLGRYHWNTGTGAPDPTRGLGTDGFLDIFNPVMPLAIGTTTPAAPGDLMNLIDGPASIGGTVVYTAAGAANFDLIINPQYPLGAAGFIIPVRATAVVGDFIPFGPVSITLPRHACGIQLRNEGSSASAINSATFFVTSQQQPE